jgi:hypothetical protein
MVLLFIPLECDLQVLRSGERTSEDLSLGNLIRSVDYSRVLLCSTRRDELQVQDFTTDLD